MTTVYLHSGCCCYLHRMLLLGGEKIETRIRRFPSRTSRTPETRESWQRSSGRSSTTRTSETEEFGKLRVRPKLHPKVALQRILGGHVLKEECSLIKEKAISWADNHSLFHNWAIFVWDVKQKCIQNWTIFVFGCQGQFFLQNWAILVFGCQGAILALTLAISPASWHCSSLTSKSCKFFINQKV